MQSDLQIWQLILQASWMVKGVMLILLVASVASWMIIFRKRADAVHGGKGRRSVRRTILVRHRSDQALRKVGRNNSGDGLEQIFESGFKEFTRMREQGRMTPAVMVEGAQRGMRIALARETERLENHLSYLATVGSTSPYIGLFGTVWGIMTSFHQLANVNQATIAMVAPGISEALIATAMGLFAAIPAVIAYNRYSNQVERLETRYDNFTEEFSSILQRQAHALMNT